MPGIDQTKNAISLVFAIIKPILSEVKKDGFQPADLMAFVECEEFKKLAEEVATNFHQLPAELRDLSLIEDVQLALMIFKEIKAIV